MKSQLFCQVFKSQIPEMLKEIEEHKRGGRHYYLPNFSLHMVCTISPPSTFLRG
jgi:hypothetical protein